MPTVRIPVDLTWSLATGSPGVNVWHARIDDLGSAIIPEWLVTAL